MTPFSTSICLYEHVSKNPCKIAICSFVVRYHIGRLDLMWRPRGACWRDRTRTLEELRVTHTFFGVRMPLSTCCLGRDWGAEL